MGQYKDASDFTKRFSGNEEMWQGFAEAASRDSVNIAAITPKMKENLQRRLKATLARYRWRNAGFYQVLNESDPMVVKALEIIKTNKK